MFTYLNSGSALILSTLVNVTAVAQSAAPQSASRAATGTVSQTQSQAAPGQPASGVAGSSEPADTSTEVTGLADIVVTAQRVSESSQRAAVAIDVVTGGDLTQAGVTTAASLTELVPALTIESAGPYNLLFVRGVGNFALTSYSDPAIAFNYDGVYVGRPTSLSGVFYDLDRVEVLKGPQGTLYGRNATGGAINVLPTEPKLGETSGWASVSYGNYDAYNVQGAINLSVDDKTSVRVAANIVSHEPYLSDGQDRQQTDAVRVQVKSVLTDDLTVRVSADYSHDGGDGAGYTYVDKFAYNPTLTSLPLGQRFTVTPSGVPLDQGAFTAASQAFRESAQAGPAGRNLDALTGFPFLHNDFYGANAQIDYETAVGTLTLIPAFRGARLDDLSGIGFFVRQQEHDDQTSLEARLGKTGVGIFDYNVGLYYFDESIKGQLNVSESALQLQQEYTTGTTSYAGFGRLTVHLTDQLRLVAGIRYTYDSKRFTGEGENLTLVCLAPACPNAPLFQTISNFSQIPFAIPPAGVPFGPGPVPGTAIAREDVAVNAHQYTGQPTYRGALEYDLTASSLLYLSVETGYRSGGFNLAAGYETYQPEYITAYTIGSKNRFLDNRLQLNIEAFDWQYRDQQLSHIGLDLEGAQNNFTQNVGTSTLRGAELDGRFLATRTTLLSADAQYLYTDYKNFTYQAPAGGTPPPYTTCAVSVAANPAFYNVNCSGKPAYNSPKWTLNLAAQQTLEFGDHKFVAGVDTQYRTSRYDGFEYGPYELVRANWRSNAFLNFAPSDDRWTVGAFVRNIEGERTPTFAANNAIGGLAVVIPSAPRTYGVTISTKF